MTETAPLLTNARAPASNPPLRPQCGKRRSPLRWLEGALWAVALAAGGYLGWVALDQSIHQTRQAKEWRESSRALATSSPGAAPAGATGIVIATAPPPAMRPRPAQGELIGRIEISGVGVSAFVAAGTDSLTMRRGVGHIDGTALPGEPGNVGLAGHRDTVFRGLRRIKVADRIVLTTPDGSFEYVVENLRTVQPSQVEVLDPSPYPTLTIVTCFPFDFIGPAPMRYIVRAREVGRTDPTLRLPRASQAPGDLAND